MHRGRHRGSSDVFLGFLRYDFLTDFKVQSSAAAIASRNLDRESPAELSKGRRRDNAFLQSHQNIAIAVNEFLIIKSIRNELEIHDVHYRRRRDSGLFGLVPVGDYSRVGIVA